MISGTGNPVTYNCDGLTTTFPITADMGLSDGGAVQVFLTNSEGEDTLLTKGSHYSIVGTDVETDATYASGNKITIAPAVNDQQLLDLIAGDPLDPDNLEGSLDKLAARIRELGVYLLRCLRIPITSASVDDFGTPDDRKDGYPHFNKTTGKLELVATLDENEVVSTAMRPVVTANTLSNARDNMGVTAEIDDLAGTGRTTETVKDNADDIASNDTDIATNVADISSNDADIATNVADISSNDADIVGHGTRITALELEPYPPGFLYGLETEADTDADHDVKINPGKCRDYADNYNLILSASIVKRIDAAWVAGTTNGGLFTGSVAADTTYHLFLIRKDSDGSIDAGWDTDIDCANIPTGYTAFRRIRSYRTDASANIIQTTQTHDRFDLKSILKDYFNVAPGTSRVTVPLGVPGDIECEANITCSVYNTTNCYILLSPTSALDVAPDAYHHTLRVQGTMAVAPQSTFGISCDINRNITFRTTDGSLAAGITIMLNGWSDDRGQHGGK